MATDAALAPLARFGNVTHTVAESGRDVFANWDRRASVRVKPSHRLAKGDLYFPPELLPVVSHPAVTRLGDAAVRRLLVHRLYQYLHFTVERQKRRAHGIVETAVGDRHVEDRLRARSDRLPDADGLEQPPRRRDDRRSARIATAARERGIGDLDLKRRAESLPQGDRQRQACKARTGDENLGLAAAFAAH